MDYPKIMRVQRIFDKTRLEDVGEKVSQEIGNN